LQTAHFEEQSDVVAHTAENSNPDQLDEAEDLDYEPSDAEIEEATIGLTAAHTNNHHHLKREKEATMKNKITP
jgi:cellobiose-specific phosphotransferase system component IIA